MATGMSNAKARRNSKTKARASRAKLGLVAKAGKRRPHNMEGWVIILCVCCALGASNSDTWQMSGVWLAASIAFGIIGVLK